jgi:hypothetical protein
MSSSNVSTGLFVNLSTGDIQSGHTQFRNRIINGDMRIDQRNAGSLLTYAIEYTYSLDRWVSTNINSGQLTIQRVTDVPQGFVYSLKMIKTNIGAGNGGNYLAQLIEGYNIADFYWGTANAIPVTISFWVKSSITGNFSLTLTSSILDVSQLCYSTLYSINTANTWEYKTIYITPPTSGTWTIDTGMGLSINFGLGYQGSRTSTQNNAWYTTSTYNVMSLNGNASFSTTLNASFQVTGVQLEKGTQATPFEFRPISIELQLCQRYFQQLNPNTSTANSSDYYYSLTSGTGEVRLPLPVAMRGNPTPSTVTSSSGSYSINSQMLRLWTTAAPGSIYFKSLTAEL